MNHSAWYAWMLLGLSAFGTCAGNMMVKQASLALPNLGFLAVIVSPWFIGAIAFYIFDLVFFTQALQYIPISIAVPVISGIRIATMAILGSVFFSEHFTINHAFASGLITAGIVIMSRT